MKLLELTLFLSNRRIIALAGLIILVAVALSLLVAFTISDPLLAGLGAS